MISKKQHEAVQVGMLARLIADVGYDVVTMADQRALTFAVDTIEQRTDVYEVTVRLVDPETE